MKTVYKILNFDVKSFAKKVIDNQGEKIRFEMIDHRLFDQIKSEANMNKYGDKFDYTVQLRSSGVLVHFFAYFVAAK